MKFEDFLTRADDELLQELLGTKVLRLLRALDPTGFNQGRQRALLLEQTRAQDLLKSNKARKALLELLRPPEADQLCRVLGLPRTLPYEALAAAAFPRLRLEALFDFFELPQLQDAERTIEPDARVVSPAHGLFPHQQNAAQQATKALRTGARRVLLHMPTGAGKTRTSMHIIATQLRDFPTKGVIWLAHSEELCEQAAAEFEQAWTNLGNRDLTVRRFWAAHNLDIGEVQSDFIVAGLPKMYATVQRNLALVGKIGARTSLVVMDEAHQAIAPTYKLILEALVDPFPETSLLGLTATPGRTWNDPLQDGKLANFFRGKKVSLEIPGYSNPVDYLIEEGYLARATFRPLLVNSGLRLSDLDREKLLEYLEIPDETLQRLAEDEVRNLAILVEVEHLLSRHKRIIVFATTVEHSDLLAYTLRARGVWARSITGACSATYRQGSIYEFKDAVSEPRVLCNFGVLTAGFDAPQISAALIARPTISLVLYSQMVGRAIRGPKAGGNVEAEIVTVVDGGLPGFGNVEDAFHNWEDVWGIR